MGMNKASGAVLYHCCGSERENAQCHLCPQTVVGWCKYKKDKVKNTPTYRKIVNTPKPIKPILRELSAYEPLSNSLHGQMQNANEVVNAILWQKCRIQPFVGKESLGIGPSSAGICFTKGLSMLVDAY